MGCVCFSGEHAAQDRFNLTFAPGLVEALAHHIGSQHGHEISQQNGGAIAPSGFFLAFLEGPRRVKGLSEERLPT